MRKLHVGLPDESTLTAPLRRLWLWETRVVREVLGVFVPRPFAARKLPRGNGQPVLVLPGFGAGDGAMRLLARRLNKLGYRAETWGLGLNDGNLGKLMPKLVERALALHRRTGQKLLMVGWSLGGTMAREFAREHPEAVAHIVTLGSPVVGGPKYTFVARHYRRRGIDLDGLERTVAEREASLPLTVPVTALYDRRDAIVHWNACIDRNNANVEHIEVSCSHLGMGFDRRVFGLIAKALGDSTTESGNQPEVIS